MPLVLLPAGAGDDEVLDDDLVAGTGIDGDAGAAGRDADQGILRAEDREPVR